MLIRNISKRFLQKIPTMRSISSSVCGGNGKTLGYVSDIHLEKNPDMDLNIKPTTDYLMLCGDIGDPFDPRYEELLTRSSDNFERVVFVAGNHEFDNIHLASGKDKKDVLDMTLDRLHEMSDKHDNVEFLHRDITTLNGYNVVGTVLWTHRVDKIKAKKRNIRYKYNTEYNRIINHEHKKDVDFLEHCLEIQKKTIVLTHHIPTYKMCPEMFMDFPSKNLFYNDLDNFFTPNIHAWLCGHSHHIDAKIIDDMYCGINSVGINRDKINDLVKVYL